MNRLTTRYTRFVIVVFIAFFRQASAQLIDVFNEEVATGPVGALPAGYSVYRIWAHVLDDNDAVTAVLGFSGYGDAYFHSIQLGSTAGDSLIWNHSFGGMTSASIISAFFGMFPETEWDSFITIGRDSNDDPGSDCWYLASGNGPFAPEAFGNSGGGMISYGQNMVTEDGEEAIWFVLPDQPNVYGQPPDNRVLLAQVAVPTGTLYYKLNLQVLDDWPETKNMVYQQTTEEPLDTAPSGINIIYVDGTCMGLVYPEPEFCYGLGCMDSLAVNFDPIATVDDGTCIYDNYYGCTDSTALNYDEEVQEDDGSCIYDCPAPHWEFTVDCQGDSTFTVVMSVEELGLLNPSALLLSDIGFYANINGSYTGDFGPFQSGDTVIFYLDPYDLDSCMAQSEPLTIDCGTFNPGCTDSTALNYDAQANWDNETCIYNCIYPDAVFATFCSEDFPGYYYVSLELDDMGNAIPYTVTVNDDTVFSQLYNPYDYDFGPYNSEDSTEVIFTSQAAGQCTLSSGPMYLDCATPITGCTDSLALNYDPLMVFDDGSCTYSFLVCDCNLIAFSPEVRFQLGNGIANDGVPGELNFNCATWGWDCGDIDNAPDEDPFLVCEGNLPDEYGCILSVDEQNKENDKLNIWPNPASETVFIASDLLPEAEIRLTDVTGRKILLTGKMFNRVIAIDVSALTAGCYMIHVEGSNSARLLVR